MTLEPRLTGHGYCVKDLADQFQPDPPRSGCSCAALSIPNVRASDPSKCAVAGLPL
jgi:hypothetical protein